MDWLKIGSAALMIGMLVFIYPRMREAVKHSPKGSMQDWMGYIVPLVAVIAFVFLLIKLV
ncbi:MAG: hypothetical protein JKY93_06420 [Gammaproteobacteria bacterium]|nr:hypothetical protein [Gammaproteobacteria bacterium]